MAMSRNSVRIRRLLEGEDDVRDTVSAGLSSASLRARYAPDGGASSGALRRALPPIDGERHVALVAEHGRGSRRRAIGLARYVRTASAEAEIAYEVVDTWQGRGIGTRLVRALLDDARRDGVRVVQAAVRSDNGASLRLLTRLLPQSRFVREGDWLQVTGYLVEAPFTLEALLADLEHEPSSAARRREGRRHPGRGRSAGRAGHLRSSGQPAPGRPATAIDEILPDGRRQ